MSKLQSLYRLCPINNDILGVSANADPSSVICTLGKKIVYVMELSTQKQLKSWSSSDGFSSKVIYDFKSGQYVGVFSSMYMRLWDKETSDFNKIKKLKFHKRIHSVINVHKSDSLVIYENGTCESLSSALESRVEEKPLKQLEHLDFSIDNPQLINFIFTYTKQIGNDKYFCYTQVDEISLKPIGELNTCKLERPGQDTELLGSVVIPSKRDRPSLITIWSDKRLFKQKLTFTEAPSIGTLNSIVDFVSSQHKLAVVPISENCIAIYTNVQNDDGSFVIMYNVKFKVIQSKLPFKVFLSNLKLWTVNENLFLTMGQHLSVIPFILSADRLSSMLGSQAHAIDAVVEKEMINEDAFYEDALEFDEDQNSVENMEFIPDGSHFKANKKLLSQAVPVASDDEVKRQLNELYRGEMVVDLIRLDQCDEVHTKILSNVDESLPLLSENFEVYCSSLERHGCSEIEITDRVLPILIKTNRTEDIGLLLKRYNHVSENMLTKVVKYLISCPNFENDNIAVDSGLSLDENEGDLNDLNVKGQKKKVPNANVFLSTRQNSQRDVLSIALCCSFDSTTILKHIKNEISLNEMVLLMDHLYKILNTSMLEELYDMRGNLVEGDDFDLDTKLFEWFRLLLDSHYQQILLSRDEGLLIKMQTWLELVDDHIRILNEMQNMRQTLVKIATNKPIHLFKKCNQWYSIEKLKLY